MSEIYYSSLARERYGMYKTDNSFASLAGNLSNASMSYIGGAVVSFDVTHTAEADLTNAPPIEDGAYKFDGVTPNRIDFGEINSDYQTMEVVFSLNSYAAGSRPHIIGNMQGGGGGLYINNSGYLVGEYFIGSDYLRVNYPEKIELNKIYSASLSYNGSNLLLVVNGKPQVTAPNGTVVSLGVSATKSGIIKPPDPPTVLSLGLDPNGTTGGYDSNRLFSGKIYAARVYDHGLFIPEILNNFNADKARFPEIGD